MALTLFVVVASQNGKLSVYLDLIIKVIPIYVALIIKIPVVVPFAIADGLGFLRGYRDFDSLVWVYAEYSSVFPR